MVLDIDRLKKVNELASNLREQGISSDRDDAAELAGNLIGSEDEHQFCKLKQAEQPETPEKPKTTFAQNQVEEIMQKFADSFCAEIEKLNKKIDELEAKIPKESPMPQQELNEEESIIFEDSETVYGENAQKTLVPEPEIEQPKAEVKPVQEQKEEPNARTGSYSPEDVSIEKFFYYGNK